MSDQGESQPSDEGDQTEQAEPAEQLRGSNVEKNPDEWVTGDQPMTGAQASYLKTLSDQAGVEFDAGLTKAEASKRIDELQSKTGRDPGRR
jgi:hypothetical protein